MADKCFAPVRGSVIRATRLDACGEYEVGTSVVAVSKRISSIQFARQQIDGTDIRDENFAGEICTEDRARPTLLGYNTDIALCGVDPAMLNLFADVPLVKNAAGDTVGFDATDDIDLDSFGFALEIWSRLAGNQCDSSGRRQWGYTVVPFIKGGVLGDFSFQNAAVNFNITGARTESGNNWGVGPYDVDLGAGPGFAPSPLHEPLPATSHFRPMIVSLDPPAPSCGVTLLAA